MLSQEVPKVTNLAKFFHESPKIMHNSWPRSNLAKSFQQRGHEGTIVESRALFGSNIGRCGHKALKISASDNPGESLFGDGGGAAGGPGRR